MKFENSTIIRFFAKFEYRENDCWVWKAATNQNGYGVVRVGKKNYLASRFIWIFLYGEIPEHKVICHYCDNPSCVNPSHLFLGDQNDNVHDMIKKGRDKKAKGTKVNTNKLSENQVIEIRKLYFCENVNQKEIAEKYRVAPNTIRAILCKRTWRWLE